MILFRKRGYSSAGRAMRSQRIGHEFESRYLHQVKFSRTNRKCCTDFGGAPRENKSKRRATSDWKQLSVFVCDSPYIVETRRYLSPLFAGSQFVQPDAIVLEVARSGNTPFAAGQFGRKIGERVPLPLIFDCPVVHQGKFSRTARKSYTDLDGAPRESK